MSPLDGKGLTKQKHKVSHSHFYFCQKMEFRTYFVYCHTFSYKFKVQQTPSEFGLPVDGATFHDRMDNKGAAFSTPSM